MRAIAWQPGRGLSLDGWAFAGPACGPLPAWYIVGWLGHGRAFAGPACGPLLAWFVGLQSALRIVCCRCSFFFLLIHALGGVWALEQPRSSLLMQYGLMRDVAARIQVYDVAFWMAGFGAKTPKRSMLWSNSIGCMHFQTPKLSMKKAKLLKDVDFGEPVMKYVHKGKKCWKGTRWLTATGILSCIN